MPAPPDRKTLIEQLKAAAAQLGREAVTQPEFRSLTGISRYQVYRHFDSYSELLRAAGFTTHGERRRIPDDELLRAMADIFRKAEGVVPMLRFGKLSRYSLTAYQRRWGGWSGVLQAFRHWQIINDPGFPYGGQIDDLPRRGPDPRRRAPLWTSLGGRQYGEALNFRGLLHAPVNEQGVVFLFAILAAELGFLIESLTTGFPDCEAKRRTGKVWERVRIEFEYQSRNFRDHDHDPAGCDLIVCWEHNWEECPLEVLALKPLVAARIYSASLGETSTRDVVQTAGGFPGAAAACGGSGQYGTRGGAPAPEYEKHRQNQRHGREADCPSPDRGTQSANSGDRKEGCRGGQRAAGSAGASNGEKSGDIAHQ